MVKRRRLDAEMVRRELVLTRSKAKELVEAGQVLVNGSVATKVSRLVAVHDPIVIPPIDHSLFLEVATSLMQLCVALVWM